MDKLVGLFKTVGDKIGEKMVLRNLFLLITAVLCLRANFL